MAKNVKCNCKWKTCKRHGLCDQCRAHHQQYKQQPPFCEQQPKDGRK